HTHHHQPTHHKTNPRPTTKLPTYPFQRTTHWLKTPATSAASVSALGQTVAGHPFLGAVLELPERDTTVFTGQLSLATHPWLADHAIHDAVLLPATALVDLALHAGARLGCPHIDELTLHTPLALSDGASRDLRLTVTGRPDLDGVRELTFHSRPHTPQHQQHHPQDHESDQDEWTHHATATLTPHTPEPPPHTTPTPTPTTWPPARTTPLDLTTTYKDLTHHGYHYGPLFQGLTQAWQHDNHIYADITLPTNTPTNGHTTHPALLDAALHPLALFKDETATGQTAVPYAFEGVVLHSVRATALRVRLTKTGEHTVSLAAHDSTGAPVITIGTLTLRPRTAPVHAVLHHTEWIARPTPSTAQDFGRVGFLSLNDKGSERDTAAEADGLIAALVPESLRHRGLWELFRPQDGESESALVQETVLVSLPDRSTPESGPAGEVREALGGVLELLRRWLADERYADTRLVLLTRRAVPVLPGEDIDPVRSALWGLVRSAQTEHPNRVSVVDLDTEPSTYAVLPHALALAGEPQLAIRGGEIHVPRIVRLPRASGGRSPYAGWNPEGTVLVTGGTGALGAQTARHLVARHGVRRLLLVSRAGPDAAGVDALCAELSEAGAEVTVAACDTADRDAVDALLRTLPQGHRLSAVIHAAGVVADGTVSALGAEQLDAVLRPKADAAWNLHRATRDLDLDAFVLFSSLAATVGSAGQANYAAANAYLDALAHHRHTLGLPATSLAWGPWADSDGMAGHLTDADIARITRTGFPPLATPDALALLDASLAVPERPALIGTALSTAALRARADGGTLPALLHELAGRSARRTARRPGPAPEAAGPPAASFVERLVGLEPAERRERLLATVRQTTASILGHSDAADVPGQSGFLDMGLDSLATIELRNTLGGLTGLQLPATLMFDHPTPAALALHLDERLTRGGLVPSPGVLGELSRLESSLAGVPAGDEQLRAEVRERLRSLLKSFDGGPENDGGDMADALLSASTEEVLRFIDQEFSETLQTSPEAVSDDER
ncbi:type I polyketide synthase, partial [Streptomyces sp. NPDC014894]|uniref:type I polyketide synthase n=1 Tax=Streptomyces sp. NPDC014894 TaxID=3364931 RepID=UPI0037011145